MSRTDAHTPYRVCEMYGERWVWKCRCSWCCDGPIVAKRRKRMAQALVDARKVAPQDREDIDTWPKRNPRP